MISTAELVSPRLTEAGPVAPSRPRAVLAALLQAGLVLLLAPALSLAVPAPVSPVRGSAMIVEVDGSSAARSIADALPASLMLSDRMGAALIAEDVEGTRNPARAVPVVDYRAGDVVWSPDRHELIVFTREGSGVGTAELVRIGTVRSGLAELQNCTRECDVSVSLDRGDSER